MTSRPQLEPVPLALLTLGLSLGTFMQVLDTSIANVSIPAIAGNVGVSPDQGTWVITSFAVSNAIALPLTGWLARRTGEVRLFVASVVLFTIASWLCGLSTSFPELLTFRVLQGAVGGPMIPLSQSLLLANYPPQRKGLALALWSMTVVVAPILGPILGGTITDTYSWPWIFYINIPVGILSSLLAWQLLKDRDTPTTRTPIDLVGLILLVVGVGTLQIMLDQGNDLNWFGSREIIMLAIVAVAALVYLVIWELNDPHPVIDLRLFARRNFAVGTIVTSLGYLAFFAGVVIFPLWLQTDMGYTAEWAGFAAAPIGILSVILTPVVGQNMHRWDLRAIATVSFIIFAIVSFWTATFTTGTDFFQLIEPRLVQGAAMATFFVPMVTISLSNLPPNQIASAAGLSNFIRLVAGSFGTSLSISLWVRRTTFHMARLTEAFSTSNPVFMEHLEHLRSLGMTRRQAIGFLARTAHVQSVLLATNDVFWVSGWLFLGLIVLVWLAKPPFSAPSGPVAVD
ncbi:MAG: DHA2 family efflux MFS transporter permease subunit [Acidiferrobacteraceae bacterium]